MIRAVVFDVGECLAAMFGAVIAQGRDYRETFQECRPGFDLTEEREKRAAAGKPEWFGEDGLYPDVRLTLAALREASLWPGIAGNQIVRAGSRPAHAERA